MVRQALAAWSLAEAGRFILFLPVFMAAGVIAYFAVPAEPPLWPAALLTLAALAAVRFARTAPLQAAALCTAFAAAGFASAGRATWSATPWPDLPRRATLVTGHVTAIDILPEGRRVTLAAPSLDGAPPLPRAVRVRLRDTDTADIQPGDRITLRALLRPPSPPAYPGGWDTQRDAFFSGLGGYGYAIGPATRTVTAATSRWQTLRQTAAARIMAALPGTRGAIAATLLTGMGNAIPAPDRAAFQASGLAHLLAVAGLHIGIVMGLAYTACRRGLALSEHAALFWPIKQFASLASLATGAFYLALTGAHVPILRSFAMACLVALAVLTGRRALSWRALALAAVGLIAFAPEQVMGVSFQMSFAAVMALIAGWEVLAPRLERLGRGAMLRHGIALGATSVLAGTASLPVAAYHFGTGGTLLRAGEFRRGAADRPLGHAVGHAGAAADALWPAWRRAGADGLGHRRAAVDRARGGRLAGGGDCRAADAASGAAELDDRADLAVPVAHAPASGGAGRDGRGTGDRGLRAAAGHRRQCRCAADRGTGWRAESMSR